MPRSCVATGCENRQDKNRPDLAFKTIPYDKKLNVTSKIKIKRDEYPKDKNIVLRWEHFTEDCFERDLQAEFKHKWTTPLYKTKDDAIPTIFSHKEKPRSRLSSEKARRELLSDACKLSSSSLISDIFAEPSDSASISYVERSVSEL